MSLIKIKNRYLDKVNWANASACDFSTRNQADVWRINISSNLAFTDVFLPILNPEELARAGRYLQLNDKNRFIISRAALRIILGKYLNLHPRMIEFETGLHKKPYIKNTNNSPLFYNLSHSGDWIIVAAANSEIGVDTEFINPSFDYLDIIKEYFSRGEAAYIGQEQSCSRFFTLWTRKEALSKATGKGLDDDLNLIPSLDGEHDAATSILKSNNDWLVDSFELSANYIASVAVGMHAGNLKFWDINFQNEYVSI